MSCLAGAILAFLVSSPRVRSRLVGRMWPRGTMVVSGAVALIATVAMWVGVERTAGFISSGGLAVVSLCSVLVVLAAASGVGPVAVLSAWRPLRWVGGVSYGAYLFHWPLFVFLSQRRTGLSHLPRFVLVVTLTFVLAALSVRLLERPVRLRQGLFAPGRLRPLYLAPVLVVALIVSVLMLDTDGRRETFDFERAQAQLDELHKQTAAQETDDTGDASATTVPEIPPPPRPRVSFYGDSAMLSLALLLGNWELVGAPVTSVEGDVQLGCGSPAAVSARCSRSSARGRSATRGPRRGPRRSRPTTPMSPSSRPGNGSWSTI